MKKYQHIEQLLDKYWEGETTLAEDKTLQKFFTSETIPIELQAFQSLFQAKSDIQRQSLNDDFDSNLLAMLDTSPKVVQMAATSESIVNTQNIQTAELQKWRWIAGIAASIALFLAVYIVMPRTETIEIAKSELNEKDHKEALKSYEQTKIALMFVSAKMNQGVQTAAKGLSKVKNLDQVINQIEQ